MVDRVLNAVTMLLIPVIAAAVIWAAVSMAIIPGILVYGLLDVASFRIFFAAIALFGLGGFMLSLFRTGTPGGRLRAIGFAGLVVTVLSAASAYLFGYECTISMTETQMLSMAGDDIVMAHAGPRARPDLKGFGLILVRGSGDEATAELLTPSGKTTVTRKGTAFKGMKMTLFEYGPSPLITVFSGKAGLRESTYVQVRPTRREERDFFFVGFLPYKMIISTEKDDPNAFHLEAWRSKRVVAEGTLAKERPLKVDNLEASLGEIRQWAEIRLRRRPGETFVLVGAAIALASVVARFFRNTRKKA